MFLNSLRKWIPWQQILILESLIMITIVVVISNIISTIIAKCEKHRPNSERGWPASRPAWESEITVIII